MSAHRRDSAAVHRLTYIEALPDRAPAVLAALRPIRTVHRRAAANRRCDVLQRGGQPAHFVVVEVWVDGPADDSARFAETLAPLLASPADVRTHGGLVPGDGDCGPAEALPAATVFVVTHVDVVPPQKDAGVALLRALATAGHAAAGNLGFEVWQQADRPNHLSVVETWRDRAAFEAFVGSAAARQFRADLAPLSGALYDQRLFAAVA